MSKATLPAIVAALSLTVASAALATNPPKAPGTTPADGKGQEHQMHSAKVTEAQVRSTLQAQGFNQIDKVELKGANYEVHAKKGAQSFLVHVDAATGELKSSTPG